MENDNLKHEKQCAIHDVSCCFVCGAKIKKEGSSLHVWNIEYECGCKIWGAIDVKTHGDSIEIDVRCPNSN